MTVRSVKVEIVLLAGIVGMAACVRMVQRLPAWPAGLPEREYFQQVYQADVSNRSLQTERQYLKWVLRFYEGWEVIPRSWKDVEADVLDGIEEERQGVVSLKLRQLGMLIAGDWAKHNSIRHISTAMLSLWGEVAEAAVETGKRDEALDLIMEDVKELLSGRILPEAINRTHYQSELGVSFTQEL
ncbi:MAG: hypothetical protein ACE5GZ_04410 [Gammaproteobacteria bacterium]